MVCVVVVVAVCSILLHVWGALLDQETLQVRTNSLMPAPARYLQTCKWYRGGNQLVSMVTPTTSVSLCDYDCHNTHFPMGRGLRRGLGVQ